jgi:hypothetical protein
VSEVEVMKTAHLVLDESEVLVLSEALCGLALQIAEHPESLEWHRKSAALDSLLQKLVKQLYER